MHRSNPLVHKCTLRLSAVNVFNNSVGRVHSCTVQIHWCINAPYDIAGSRMARGHPVDVGSQGMCAGRQRGSGSWQRYFLMFRLGFSGSFVLIQVRCRRRDLALCSAPSSAQRALPVFRRDAISRSDLEEFYPRRGHYFSKRRRVNSPLPPARVVSLNPTASRTAHALVVRTGWCGRRRWCSGRCYGGAARFR